jgi:ABC-2 type transport system permease protein
MACIQPGISRVCMNAEDRNISGSMKNVYTPMIASRERSSMPVALDSAPNTTPTPIEEIDRGTLNRFLASPASRIGIMNASVVEQAVSTTVQSLIIVGLGLIGGARYHGGVAVMVAASILVGVVFGALSNVVGMLLRSREAIIGVYTFFMLPLIFLSSAFMPTQLMPGWMQAIASRNPLNWVVQIGRSALSAHPDWGAIGVRCGLLLVLAVACVATSVVTFRSYQKNV